jgi:hypothetical protein
MWRRRFAATCDILLNWVVIPQELTNYTAIFNPDVRIREAASRFTTRDDRLKANSKIRGLFYALGHNNVSQWGTKEDVPVLKKTSLLGKRKRTEKRKRTSLNVLDYGGYHDMDLGHIPD